jgi:hypothetical protein
LATSTNVPATEGLKSTAFHPFHPGKDSLLDLASHPSVGEKLKHENKKPMILKNRVNHQDDSDSSSTMSEGAEEKVMFLLLYLYAAVFGLWTHCHQIIPSDSCRFCGINSNEFKF